MCILKIHANSHSANAIQSALHNLQTAIMDAEFCKDLLSARGHKTEVEPLNLALFHAKKSAEKMAECWQGFIADSPILDTPPIGAESMPVNHNEYGAYFQHGDGRVSAHDVPTSFYGLSVEETLRQSPR